MTLQAQNCYGLLPLVLPSDGVFPDFYEVFVHHEPEDRKAPRTGAFHWFYCWWPQRDSNPCFSGRHVFAIVVRACLCRLT